MMIRGYLFRATVTTIFLFGATSSYADEYTSASFRSVDPVITPAAFSSSSGFRLFGNISQVSIGTSSASSYGLNAGFLYFPYVTSPVVSATAKPQKVDLVWTAAEGFLGLTPATYQVGQSLISGGPYTIYSVGNVLSFSQTNVSSGVTYYFIVKALDLFSNTIATSTEVSAIPQPPGQATPSVTPPQGGGASGGGGGGGGGGIATNVTFKGRAYPLSKVTVLKDGQIAITTIAGPDANFEIILNSMGAGSFVFGVYGEDHKNRRSSIFTFPIIITTGASAVISGIFITPTIDVDKSEVKRGENIAILGQSVPRAEIVISINSETELFAKANADKDGIYLYNLDTSPLELGDHAAKSKASSEGLISSFGNSVGFRVGTKTIVGGPKECALKGDVNNDCRVNLVDFSIVAYWWKRTLPENIKRTIDDKLWSDGVITLRDFSIMAYYWTG